jgi:hypothetical protein
MRMSIASVFQCWEYYIYPNGFLVLKLAVSKLFRDSETKLVVLSTYMSSHSSFFCAQIWIIYSRTCILIFCLDVYVTDFLYVVNFIVFSLLLVSALCNLFLEGTSSTAVRSLMSVSYDALLLQTEYCAGLVRYIVSSRFEMSFHYSIIH